MKTVYENPEMELVKFESEDIITTSLPGFGEDDEDMGAIR